MTEYIKREDALRAVKHAWAKGIEPSEYIEDIEAADVAPVVHGQWEQTEYPFMTECDDCSECGFRTVFGNGWNYCPNCGARMDGGKDDA